MKIKKGDVVGRLSYGKDILFTVERIIKTNTEKPIVILKGITHRIVADAPIEDLELIKKSRIESSMRSLDYQLENRIKKIRPQKSKNIFKRTFPGSTQKIIQTGRILHLDGDRKYSDKSASYYKIMGLNAIVKNIPENRQPALVKKLLDRYKPDILVITGHDGMIKNGTKYNDIYNYRNSKYFIDTVKEARAWSQTGYDLVIFAGACQSFFEAIMEAGANFASSPARILIDFMDPLIVAEKVATTEEYKYITINDIAYELRDGTKGVGGSRSKREKMYSNYKIKFLV